MRFHCLRKGVDDEALRAIAQVSEWLRGSGHGRRRPQTVRRLTSTMPRGERNRRGLCIPPIDVKEPRNLAQQPQAKLESFALPCAPNRVAPHALRLPWRLRRSRLEDAEIAKRGAPPFA